MPRRNHRRWVSQRRTRAERNDGERERERERDLGLGDPGDDGGLEEKGCWAEFGLSGISEK